MSQNILSRSLKDIVFLCIVALIILHIFSISAIADSDTAITLWSSDSAEVFTTIGHLAREAMQEFAAALINMHQPSGVETDVTKTVSRIRAVLNHRSQTLGSTEKAFLYALLDYWGTVSDLIQRQEHGGLREHTPLIWEDARRVVFQVITVMFEIDRAIPMKV